MTDRERRRAYDGDPAKSGKIKNGKRIHTPSPKENAAEKKEDHIDERQDLSKTRGRRFNKTS